MTKRRNENSNDDLATGISYGLMLLALAAAAPVIAWWNSFPPEGHIVLIVGVMALFVIGLALAWVLREHHRREQAVIWSRAMANWEGSPTATLVAQRHSAYGLTETELEQFAAQVYAKMGYQAKRTGQTGDHGIDVWLVNPKQQVELVQCKQWNKPVGEPQVRELAGAMVHTKAIRSWLWAPCGFSKKAKDWAKGKPIILMDDAKIKRLVQSAYSDQ